VIESREEPESEVGPAEVQQALSMVSQALVPLKEHKTVTWLLDSGFDDVAVWRTIWEQQEHLVSRLYHTDRKYDLLLRNSPCKMRIVPSRRQNKATWVRKKLVGP